MKALIRRAAVVLALVLAVSACTPLEMQAWLDQEGLPPFDNDEELEVAADWATRYWDAVFAELERRASVPSHPWDALAQCEAGGNWGAATGNGFYGGLQFLASTWTAYGGGEFAPSANLATREQQIMVGQRIVASHGGSYRAWPACRRRLGLA